MYDSRVHSARSCTFFVWNVCVLVRLWVLCVCVCEWSGQYHCAVIDWIFILFSSSWIFCSCSSCSVTGATDRKLLVHAFSSNSTTKQLYYSRISIWLLFVLVLFVWKIFAPKSPLSMEFKVYLCVLFYFTQFTNHLLNMKLVILCTYTYIGAVCLFVFSVIVSRAHQTQLKRRFECLLFSVLPEAHCRQNDMLFYVNASRFNSWINDNFFSLDLFLQNYFPKQLPIHTIHWYFFSFRTDIKLEVFFIER